MKTTVGVTDRNEPHSYDMVAARTVAMWTGHQVAKHGGAMVTGGLTVGFPSSTHRCRVNRIIPRPHQGRPLGERETIASADVPSQAKDNACAPAAGTSPVSMAVRP